MLTTNSYVIVVCLDFSKAFDTDRHSTLWAKLAQFDIQDNVYNWMVDFFSSHSHYTQYGGQTSPLQEITASVIQGSSIGPATYAVNAADLKTITPSNEMDKFADDSYITIPAVSSGVAMASSTGSINRGPRTIRAPNDQLHIIFTRNKVPHNSMPL